MLSNTANHSATSRFNGFSTNSLFVSLKNLENKLESREKLETAPYHGKENVDISPVKRQNYCLDLIKRHLEKNPNAF